MMRDVLARRPAASFVAVTFLVSWGVWIPASQVFSTTAIQFVAVAVGSFGPAIAAVVLVVATGESLRDWVTDMARWRLSPRWYLAAIGLPVVFTAVETIVYAAIVGPLDPSTLPQRFAFWVGSFLFALVLTGGNEEPGWRGFLQPELQRSYSALTAAALVGVVWTVWHVPLDVLMPAALDGGGYNLTDALSRLATFPLAILYAWLYNSTDGSVIITMLFHAGWNSTEVLLPAPLPGEGSGSAAAGSVTPTATRVAMVLVVLAFLLVAYDRETLAPGRAHLQRGRTTE